eukprot:Tbor_TRINITY_DN5654_c2_g8::TRINITY_DN5654_c2_g8_i1::g.9360::m.9360
MGKNNKKGTKKQSSNNNNNNKTSNSTSNNNKSAARGQSNTSVARPQNSTPVPEQKTSNDAQRDNKVNKKGSGVPVDTTMRSENEKAKGKVSSDHYSELDARLAAVSEEELKSIGDRMREAAGLEERCREQSRGTASSTHTSGRSKEEELLWRIILGHIQQLAKNQHGGGDSAAHNAIRTSLITGNTTEGNVIALKTENSSLSSMIPRSFTCSSCSSLESDDLLKSNEDGHASGQQRDGHASGQQRGGHGSKGGNEYVGRNRGSQNNGRMIPTLDLEHQRYGSDTNGYNDNNSNKNKTIIDSDRRCSLEQQQRQYEPYLNSIKKIAAMNNGGMRSGSLLAKHLPNSKYVFDCGAHDMYRVEYVDYRDMNLLGQDSNNNANEEDSEFTFSSASTSTFADVIEEKEKKKKEEVTGGPVTDIGSVTQQWRTGPRKLLFPPPLPPPPANGSGIEPMPVKGRGLVAIRNIPSDTIIMSAKPDIGVLYSSHARTRCSSCFVDVSSNSTEKKRSSFMCEYCCHFILCDQCSCDKAWEEHHLPCHWFSILPEDVKQNDTDYVRFLLNYCARVQGGDRRLLCTLERLCANEHAQRDEVRKFCSSYSKLVYNTFSPYGLLVAQEHLYKALLKTKSNAIGFPFDESSTLGWAIQLDLCMLNHSCSPNCVISQSPSGHIELKAIRHIMVGEEVTIAYINVPFHPNVIRRRAHLMNEYRFACCCELCVQELKNLKETEDAGEG